MKILKSVALLIVFTLTSISFQSCADKLEAKTQLSTSQNTNLELKKNNANRTKGLNWLNVESLKDLDSTSDKLVLVDVYTDWCKWCKVMDQKTFSNPEVVDYLSQNYEVVKFNAEQKSSIELKGKKYDFVQQGKRGVNSFAVELLGQRLSYPSFVILDQNLNKLKVISGFKSPEQMLDLLKQIQS